MTKFHQLHPSIKIRLHLQFLTILASMTIMPYIAVYFTELVGQKITGILSYVTSPWLLIVLMVFISIGELMYVPIRQSLLAELADETLRSSYLALNSLMTQGTMIIAGATISIGGIAPASVMSGSFFVMGMAGVFMMSYVMKQVQGKKGSLYQRKGLYNL